MFKNYLKGIEGIGNYPLFSLIVFFLFFAVVFIWVVMADKKHLAEMSKLPLNDTISSSTNL